jgi:CrcB protein
MKVLLLRCLVVGVAGFAGAVVRFLVTIVFGRLTGRFPVGTLVINLSGSLFLGWFLTYAGSRNLSDTFKLSVGVGFVGAYTTFSTYMYDSNKLLEDGSGIKAMVNLIGSLVLGMLAVRLGIFIARWS